jgi:hypothetical protein
MTPMKFRLGPALALASTIGCGPTEPEGCEVWQRPSNLDVAGTTADLLGLERNIVAGTAATVVIDGQMQSMPSGVDADLLDIVQLNPFTGGQQYLAVGTGGTVLHGRAEEYDDPLTWSLVDVGTTADLRAIGSFELLDNIADYHLALVGDGVLIERTPMYGDNLEVLYEWTVPDPPPEGWGSLRSASTAEFYTGMVVGDGGRVFQRDELYVDATWSAVDVGTSEDLLAYCSRLSSPRMVGRNGTMIERDSNYDWVHIDIGVDEDLVACDMNFVLTASGRVLNVERGPDGVVVTEVATVAGLRALRSFENYAIMQFCVQAVGQGGVAIESCPCDDEAP